MKIILIDDYGHRERRDVGPEDVITIRDEFVPCTSCGNAVFARDVDDDLVCFRCRAEDAVAKVEG
jgi:hypothetical protein